MSLLKPTILLKSVTDISVKLLNSLSVDLLLVDVDNTLAHASSPEPFLGVKEWLLEMKNSNFKIVVVSNNFEKRVSKFAKMLDLPFVSLAVKPMPFGFNRAIQMFNVDKAKSVVIGDQIFNDVLGANLIGAKSILLEPTQNDETTAMRIRRKIEKPIRNSIKKGNKEFWGN